MGIIKACLFDLDGVIVDTAKYHFIAWRELAGELGFEFTEKDNERLKGVSRMTSLEILLEVGGLTFSPEKKMEMAQRKNERYVSYISKMTPSEILPGVITFLDEVKKTGLKTAIGSASKNTPLILERVNLAHFFDAVIDGNKVSKAKPDPEVFLKGAEELGVMPSECVVFEDAVSGIDAAINGGMKSVGVGDPSVLWKANKVIPGFECFTVKELFEI
jgi:beta-phosphoglucomutase